MSSDLLDILINEPIEPDIHFRPGWSESHFLETNRKKSQFKLPRNGPSKDKSVLDSGT